MLAVVRTDAQGVETGLAVTIDKPVVALVGVDEGQVVGAGGLGWGDGRCWLWFHMKHSSPGYATRVLREARRLLRLAGQLGETTVHVYRDARFATSEKLLTMLGFSMTGCEIGPDGNDHEVWTWRTSP